MKRTQKSHFRVSHWKKWAPDPLTFLSGILIALAFPPWNLWPLAWICLVPWLAALDNASTRKDATIQGFWLSYFMSLGSFYWVVLALRGFVKLNWPLSILGFQLFCMVGQPQFFVFAPLFKKFNRSSLSIALLLAFSYTGIDWGVPKLFKDTLGHSLYLARNLRQLADLGGATLLTFLIFFVNHALWNSFREWREWKTKKKIKHFQVSQQLLATLVLCVLGFGYGSYRYKAIHSILKDNPQGIQAAVIQANIGNFDKIAAERGAKDTATQVLDTFTNLSHDAMKLIPRPEIIIWPETSYPGTFRNPQSPFQEKMDNRVDDLARSLQVPLVFGGYNHTLGKDYNSFFSLTPGGALEVYRKTILLPFGEYVPGAEGIPILKRTFSEAGNFGRGEGPEALTLESSGKKLKMGPIICYEVLFPEFALESARKGSQLLINITNDSWFGTWGEPQLHLSLSAFRSIETRLPMIRSANTGIAALIQADGEITHSTKIGEKATMNVFVPITRFIPTFVKTWGDWFGVFSLAVALISFFVYQAKRLAGI